MVVASTVIMSNLFSVNVSAAAAAAASVTEDLDVSNVTSEYAVLRVIDAHYYPLVYKLVGCICVTTIFIVGLLGNLMVVIVVARTKGMRTPTNCYLVSLAVADLICLISATLPTIAEYFLIEDEFIFGQIACSLMVFLQYLGVNVSAMSITAFTIERYIAICYPMKAHSLCTVKRAFRIITMVWLFGLLYCAPWCLGYPPVVLERLALTTLKTIYLRGGQTIEKCTFKLMRKSYLTYYMADFIIFYITPLLITIILYTLILRVLFTGCDITTSTGSTKRNRSDNNSYGTPVSFCKEISETNGSKLDQQLETMLDKKSKKPSKTKAPLVKSSGKNSRHQVVKMLLLVVFMFAILWMPYRVFVVYNSFARNRFTDPWFMLFCRLMVYTNSAVNPILYNAMSVKFRKAFKELLLCNKTPHIYDNVSVSNASRFRATGSSNTGL